MPYSAWFGLKPSMTDRSPSATGSIFYFGHLEAFDWNLIRQAAGVPSFHPEFDQLFAFGIDPKPGQLPSRTSARIGRRDSRSPTV